MKRSFLLLYTIGLLGCTLSTLAAQDDDEDSKYFFYDPRGPIRNSTTIPESIIIPKGPAAESRFVTAYTAMEFPEGPKDPKPEISVTFNGVPIKVGPAPEGGDDNKTEPAWFIVGNKPVDRAELRWSSGSGPLRVRIVVKVHANKLAYKLDGGSANTVEVTAKLANGEVITKDLDILGVDFPPLDQLRIVGEFVPTSRFNYSIGYHVPPTPLKVGQVIPALGKFGFTLELVGRMNFFPFQKKYTSETLGGVGLTIADKDYSVEVGSKETTMWQGETVNNEWKEKWVKTESKVYLGWSQSIVLWEQSLFAALPAKGKEIVETVPFFGKQLKKNLDGFKLDLTANPALYGEASLATTPEEKPVIRSLAFGGEMDLRLGVHAVLQISGLGKFGAEGMLGGKVNLDLSYPVNTQTVIDNLSGEIYLGASIYFLCFETSMKYTILQFHFPDAPQGALPPLDPSELAPPPTGMAIVPPPEAGEQIDYPLAPVVRSAPRSNTPSLAAAKAMFRRLGTDRVLTRRSLMPMGLGSEPVIEASAVLPLAVNTTSVAWPSIASNVQNGEMLALFGVDTRPPGTASTDAQFTEIRWTAFKNGEWSQPLPLPAGNGAAQIAPTVARLADTKPGFIAAWQQLQDPAFNGTQLEAWLNQTQVAVGVLGAENGQGTAGKEWKTKILGTPDRADLSPKVTGHLGAKREDGLAMWVSTGLSSAPKGEEATLPDDAEFRYAIYHGGDWTSPDYSNEEIRKKQVLKAPKGLLAWEISGDQQSTYLVYSEDLGEGKSRIMAYVQLVATDNLQLNEWRGPIAISDKEGKNLNPQILLDRNHNPAILWAENGSLVAKRFGAGFRGGSKVTLRAAGDGATPPAAKMTLLHSSTTGNDSDIAVSWTEQTQDGPSIVTTIFEYQTNSWSKPMAITPGEALETLYATTTDQFGNLVPLYVHTDIAYGTVVAPNAKGVNIAVPNSPIPGREKVMIGRFRPTRDLGFAPDALTTNVADFIGGTTAKLTARVKAEGMLGFKSVSVAFYHGDPKKGGKLINTVTSKQPLPGGGTIDISTDWSLSEDIWDHDNVPEDVYAVIQPPNGINEWNPDNNKASLNLIDGVPAATAEANNALQDGSAEVSVTVHNGGAPYLNPFRVVVYDYTGAREISSETVPKVDGGEVSTVKIDLPEKSVQGNNGADFLIKIDPGNTLKLPKHRLVSDLKLHIKSATH